MVRRRRGPQRPPGDEFAEFVRQSLHAAADQVEPSPDGLDRIRDKIRTAPVFASARNPEAGGPSVLARWGFLADLIRRLSWGRGEHGAPRGHGAAPGRRGTAPGRGPGPGHARPARRPADWREAMLRPALAVGIALFVVAVVLYTVPPLRTALVQVSGVGSPATSASATGQGSSGHRSGVGVYGSGQQAGGVVAPSATACPSSGSAKPSTTPTRSTAPASPPTSPSATPQTPGSPSGSGVPIPVGSTSTSAGASPSGSTSASASANGSASPSGSASAKASASARSSAPATASGPATGSGATPSGGCSSQAPSPGATIASSAGTHSATATASPTPTATADPSPSAPDSSATGSNLDPGNNGSPGASVSGSPWPTGP